MSDFRDSIRGARLGLDASSARAQARPQPVTEPPFALTPADQQRIAETWWEGNLNVGDVIELENGVKATCCGVEVGGGHPPLLTFRLASGSPRVVITLDGIE